MIAVPLALGRVPLGIVLAIVLLGGLVKGVAGFGYAVTSIALLALMLDPAAAVTLMILPALVANDPLVAELDREAVQLSPAVLAIRTRCAGRDPGGHGRPGSGSPGRAGARPRAGHIRLRVFGTAVSGPSRLGPHRRSAVPARDAHQGLVGTVSGLVFGASNIAVQVVTYLDHLELDRSTFVGVLAMVLVGISTVRVGAAWLLGLYGAGSLLALSGLAVLPGLAGVFVGDRLRPHVPAPYQQAATLGLLTVIAARLTWQESADCN